MDKSPDQNIGEVTLIGTGGGYGESCVVHLGNNEWMVVDSCQNPETKECLPLSYLQKLGVDVQTQVKLIICTHWHDDHILGMATLLRECKACEFYFASCTDRDKFLTLVEIDTGKGLDNPASSSTREFYNCLHILAERKITPKRAIMDRPLYISNVNGIVSQVFSLSPSDFTLEKFDLEISSLIEVIKQRNRKLINTSPNAKSVVLYIKINDHRILLGADLEISKEEKEGWHNIVNTSKILEKGVTLFKIPHHGSENGYFLPVWEKIVNGDAIAPMTPWNKGRSLPQIEMLKKYAEHTVNLYLTANVQTLGNKAKNREPSLSKLIKERNPTLREVKFKDGLIRSRIDLSDPNASWNTETYGEALHVNKTILK